MLFRQIPSSCSPGKQPILGLVTKKGGLISAPKLSSGILNGGVGRWWRSAGLYSTLVTETPAGCIRFPMSAGHILARSSEYG